MLEDRYQHPCGTGLLWYLLEGPKLRHSLSNHAELASVMMARCAADVACDCLVVSHDGLVCAVNLMHSQLTCRVRSRPACIGWLPDSVEHSREHPGPLANRLAARLTARTAFCTPGFQSRCQLEGRRREACTLMQSVQAACLFCMTVAHMPIQPLLHEHKQGAMHLDAICISCLAFSV